MKDYQLNKFKHHIDLNVRFMDVDALHHVNNARYLNFLEESRIAYSQEILGMFKQIDEFNVVVARIEIDFLQSLAFHDKVRVYTRVSKVGNKSFEFESLICAMRNDKAVPAAHAMQTIVGFDMKTQKSIPIPEDLKLKVNSYETDI
ncbi:MAG: thioesterase [Flavobacteriales bacterium]|nr:thioesterase [Flavobacteriales bacterium]|tara:strand:+ start:1068 stop:1505 length:438 start_codon:yes stop_codon:yes gene_type:complete